MTRPIEDWADLKYRPKGHLGHIVPFGAQAPLCNIEDSTDWHGTGSMDEIEHALALPLCGFCQLQATPTARVLQEESA